MPDRTKTSAPGPTSNPDRAPATAPGNAVNMGFWSLVLVWFHSQLLAWIPVDLDPASGLPVDGSAEGQQALVLAIIAVAAAAVGFGSNVAKNVSAGKDSTMAERIAAKIAERLP